MRKNECVQNYKRNPPKKEFHLHGNYENFAGRKILHQGLFSIKLLRAIGGAIIQLTVSILPQVRIVFWWIFGVDYRLDIVDNNVVR